MMHFGRSFFYLAYSVTVAVIAGARSHTPNFAWMHSIWPYGELTRQSHLEIFRNTLIPVFRPFLHIEKILGQIGGMPLIEFGNAFIYGISVFYIVHLSLSRLLIHADSSSIPQWKSRLIAIILASLPIYLYTSTFGSITDVLYPLGVILYIYSILNCLETSDPRSSYKGLPSVLLVFVGSLGLVLVMLSRPYGIITAPLLFVAGIFHKIKPAIIAFIISTLIAAPYHINQTLQTGSPVLSNWGGCNLAEVFVLPKDKNVLPPASNQKISSEICKEKSKIIISNLKLKPLNSLLQAIKINRLRQIVFPPSFRPYKPYPAEINLKTFHFWGASALNILLFISILTMFFSEASYFIKHSTKSATFSSVITSCVMFAPFIIAFFTHHGHESLRLSLYAYLPIFFMATCFSTANKIPFEARQ